MVLRAGAGLLARIDEGEEHILTRVQGIVPAAPAVRYDLNGVSVYHRTLTARGRRLAALPPRR